MAESSSKPGGPQAILITQKFASLGGSQVSLVHTLRLLDRMRFAPHVVVSNEGWLTQQLDALRVPWTLAKFGHATGLGALPVDLLRTRKLARHPGDGSGHHRSCLEFGRSGRDD